VAVLSNTDHRRRLRLAAAQSPPESPARRPAAQRPRCAASRSRLTLRSSSVADFGAQAFISSIPAPARGTTIPVCGVSGFLNPALARRATSTQTVFVAMRRKAASSGVLQLVPLAAKSPSANLHRPSPRRTGGHQPHHAPLCKADAAGDTRFSAFDAPPVAVGTWSAGRAQSLHRLPSLKNPHRFRHRFDRHRLRVAAPAPPPKFAAPISR